VIDGHEGAHARHRENKSIIAKGAESPSAWSVASPRNDAERLDRERQPAARREQIVWRLVVRSKRARFRALRFVGSGALMVLNETAVVARRDRARLRCACRSARSRGTFGRP